jgi:hypothetical protein
MEILLFLAAILILWFVLTWFLKVTAATIKNGAIIIIILIVLYVFFKITPAEIWEQIQRIFQGKR